MSGNQQITYAIDFGPGRPTRRKSGETPDIAIPRIARLMALAIRFDGLLRNQTIRDYAELARLGRVTEPESLRS